MAGYVGVFDLVTTLRSTEESLAVTLEVVEDPILAWRTMVPTCRSAEVWSPMGDVVSVIWNEPGIMDGDTKTRKVSSSVRMLEASTSCA